MGESFRIRAQSRFTPERLLRHRRHAAQNHYRQHDQQTAQQSERDPQQPIDPAQATRFQQSAERHRQQACQQTGADKQRDKRQYQPQYFTRHGRGQHLPQRSRIGIRHHKRQHPADPRQHFFHQPAHQTDHHRGAQYEQHQIVEYRHALRSANLSLLRFHATTEAHGSQLGADFLRVVLVTERAHTHARTVTGRGFLREGTDTGFFQFVAQLFHLVVVGQGSYLQYEFLASFSGRFSRLGIRLTLQY